jgi:hypothetical protein
MIVGSCLGDILFKIIGEGESNELITDTLKAILCNSPFCLRHGISIFVASAKCPLDSNLSVVLP